MFSLCSFLHKKGEKESAPTRGSWITKLLSGLRVCEEIRWKVLWHTRLRQAAHTTGAWYRRSPSGTASDGAHKHNVTDTRSGWPAGRLFSRPQKHHRRSCPCGSCTPHGCTPSERSICRHGSSKSCSQPSGALASTLSCQKGALNGGRLTASRALTGARAVTVLESRLPDFCPYFVYIACFVFLYGL